MNKEQLHAGLEIIKAIANTIRELREVPAGVLYAQVMGHLSLEQFEKIIGILHRSGVIYHNGETHLIRWNIETQPAVNS